MSEQYLEYFNQGELLLSQGKAEKALEYYQKAEVLEPKHTELYVSMGIALANLEKYDDAEKTFKKAVLADKKCGEAQYHLGCLAALQEDFGQASKYLEMAQLNGYVNEQVLYTQGMVAEEQGNVNLAIRYYNKALTINPVSPDIHLKKCALLIDSDRRKEALEALEQMIQNCPDYYEGYHYKCSILSELGLYEEAFKTLDQGLELFPAEMGFKIDKAKVYILQEKYKEAETLLFELSKEDNEEWKRTIYMERIRVAGIQNDAEKTMALLEEAYKVCRDGEHGDEEIAYYLLNVYMSYKNYEKAMTVAEEIKKFATNDSYKIVAHFYYAEALKNSGKEEESKPYYEENVKLCRSISLKNPAAIDAYMIRGLSLNRLGENEKALELIDYVCEFAPDSVEVHGVRAMILKDMQLMDDYEKEIQLLNDLGGNLGTIIGA